jgi:uncharacterized membrane protein YhaH (DUF805 family)
MLSSLRHCHSNLANFSGRDSRRTFWPYALIVLPLPLIIWAAGFELFLTDVLDRQTEYFENLVADHPERATITETERGRSIVFDRGYDPPPSPHDAELARKVTGVFLAAIIVGAVLLSAAATRRLHDTSRSAVSVFVVMSGYIGLISFSVLILSGQEFIPVWIIAIVGLLTFGALMWAFVVFYFLLLPGADQPNQHGPPPVE